MEKFSAYMVKYGKMSSKKKTDLDSNRNSNLNSL